MKKVYYKIEFELTSPLNIGSGENDSTDRDILRNGLGKPFIPGSSIAGVSRHALINSGIMSKDDCRNYFGDVEINTSTGESDSKAIESKLIFYDANLTDNEYMISVRDNVALDDYKTAKDGAKFDMEILEPGAKFVSYIEQSMEDDSKDVAGMIADLWKNGKVCFGSKTTRGFGTVKTNKISCRKFDFPKDINCWIDFDMVSDDTSWTDCNSAKSKSDECIKIALELKQVGGVSIRRYTTAVSDDGMPQPDMEQLTIHGDIPVIPGSSWAGAFRHRMSELLNESDINDLFGSVSEKTKKKSKVYFSESQIKDAKSKLISRNAIDRFTGGTVDGALFTEKTYCGGTTELKISIPFDTHKYMREALASAITDLHYGFMAIGGETSIGRGIFEIETINGYPLSEGEDVFNKVLNALTPRGAAENDGIE